MNHDSPSDGTEQEWIAERVAEWLAPAGCTSPVGDRARRPGAQHGRDARGRRRPDGRAPRPHRHRVPRRDRRAPAVSARRRSLLRARRGRHEGRRAPRGGRGRAARRGAEPAVLGGAPPGVCRRGDAAARAGRVRRGGGRCRRARVRVRARERRPRVGAEGRDLADALAARPPGSRGGRHAPRPQRRLGAGARDPPHRGAHGGPTRDDVGDHDGSRRRLREHRPGRGAGHDRHPLERARGPRVRARRARARRGVRRRHRRDRGPRHLAADAANRVARRARPVAGRRSGPR